MEVYQLILLGVVIAAVVGAIAWFGPRIGQWRTHDGRPTRASKPLGTLPEEDHTAYDDADEKS